MQTIKKFKHIFFTVLELMQVRLETARIEIIQQKNFLVTLLISLLFCSVLLFIALISLLFGLNSYLEPEIRHIVFFSISGGAVLIIAILFFSLFNAFKKQQSFLSSTLNEVKTDIAEIKALFINKSSDKENE